MQHDGNELQQHLFGFSAPPLRINYSTKICVSKLILQQRRRRPILVCLTSSSPLSANEDIEPNGSTIVPAPLSPSSDQRPKTDGQTSLAERRRIFKQIIVKCVLQLLLIETTNDLLRNDEIYNTIPPAQLLRMMSVLDQSYQFARSFNEDKELRTGLWKVGG